MGVDAAFSRKLHVWTPVISAQISDSPLLEKAAVEVAQKAYVPERESGSGWGGGGRGGMWESERAGGARGGNSIFFHSLTVYSAR